MTPFTWLDGVPDMEIAVNYYFSPQQSFYNIIILFVASLSSYLRKVNTTVMSNVECQSVYGTAGVTDSDVCSRGTNLVGICSVSIIESHHNTRQYNL